MKLKFVKPQEIDRNIKASVHSSGKLRFSSEASTKLDLINQRGILIAFNEDENDENLYVKFQKECDQNCFKIIKSGKYFYVNIKAFFENYNIDYKKNRIIY